jgi:hypothetical protein
MWRTRRTLFRTPLALAVAAQLGVGVAHAEPSGVVVRLDARAEPVQGTVSVTLRPQVGDPVDIALRDDGQAPDVAAGDHLWSGSGLIEGEGFDVRVKLGSRELRAGSIRWGAADRVRDLDARLAGGQVSLQASVSGGAGAASQGGAPVPGGTVSSGASPSAAASGSPAGMAAPVQGTVTEPLPPTPVTSVAPMADADPDLDQRVPWWVGFGWGAVGTLWVVGLGLVWALRRR